MKRSKDFVLREIAGKTVLVPFGKNAIDFNGIVTLNETAKLLWEKSEGEIDTEKLENALINEYGIDSNTAKDAVDSFIVQLKEAGCIDD